MPVTLFQRAQKFVACGGQQPLDLGNQTALIADSSPDSKGGYPIRLWKMTVMNTPDYPITAVTYWQATHSRLLKKIHLGKIFQIASFLYLKG